MTVLFAPLPACPMMYAGLLLICHTEYAASDVLMKSCRLARTTGAGMARPAWTPFSFCLGISRDGWDAPQYHWVSQPWAFQSAPNRGEREASWDSHTALVESFAQTFCACCAYQGADHGLGSQCCIEPHHLHPHGAVTTKTAVS